MSVRFGGPSYLYLVALPVCFPFVMGVSGHAQASAPQTGQEAELRSDAGSRVIPQLVRYAGKLNVPAGQTVQAEYRIYAAQEGGEPLWAETQQVKIGMDGSYTVLLGSASAAGLPSTVFATGEARWLGVSVERAPELDRVLLSSVPYAMKSADAESLAGHAASDFVTQEQLTQLARSPIQQVQKNVASPDFEPNTSGTVTGSGAAGSVPLWTGALTQGNSIITEAGAKIGINEPSPTATLTVNGSTSLLGSVLVDAPGTATAAAGEQSHVLEMRAQSFSSAANASSPQTFTLVAAPAGNDTATPSAILNLQFQSGGATNANILSIAGNGTLTTKGDVMLTSSDVATASGAVNSPLFELNGSAFSSGTSQAVPQHFAWRTVATGNDTAAPSANLALLYGSGTAAPASTGLSVSPTGIINWASGQSFPGTGTITGITTSTPLSGSGTAGSVALGLNETTLTADIAPKLESTFNGVYAQLGAPNTFQQNQAMNHGLTVGGTASINLVNSTTGYQLGGVAFESGNSESESVSLGFSSSPSETGSFNLGIGPSALAAVTTGESNIAVGGGALDADLAGGFNTAVGVSSLNADQDGHDNTAVGFTALLLHPSGSDNTAIGSGALKIWPAGNGNTAVGYLAGDTINGQPGGANKTFIGSWTKSEGTKALTDATVIGANGVVGESNALILGGTGNDAVSVGIGTATPFNDYALDVEAVTLSQIKSGVVVNANGGNLYLGMTNGVHKFRVDTNGEVHAAGYETSGADFAESVAVRGKRSKYEPGDLLVIDASGTRRLELSHTPYSTLVAGIYSTRPGMLASPYGIDDPRPHTTEVPLAVVGIVPCKVSAENGPIRVGDLLVTSSRPGYAMKGTDRRRMLGAVVGKALEPLPGDAGVIQVLVTLQ